MTNTEIIQAIKAEIERRIADNSFGAKLELIDILTWLSDLEKSLPAKVADGEELENELVRFYLKDLCASEDDELTDATRHHHFPIMWDDLRDIARHFYNLGKSERPIYSFDELEHEADDWIGVLRADADSGANEDWNIGDIYRTAQYFAKWGAEHTPLPEDTALFNKGVEEGKRLMMEEAEPAEIGYFNHRGLSILTEKSIERMPVSEGDKVRVIIIKKED